MKMYENLSDGSGVVAFGQVDGQADRHDALSSRYSPCKGTISPKFNEVQRHEAKVQFKDFQSAC